MSGDGPALQGRIALITGASRGIGRAVALALGRAGAHVVATARTRGGLEELDDEIADLGGTATLADFDLRDHDAIDRLGQAIFERWGRLDILIGNAAMLGPLSPVGHIKPKEWERLIAVNLTANLRLIRACDLLLRQADHGRAVFLTTTPGPRAYWGGYKASKAALDALILAYAAECANTRVKVNLLNPGPTRTAMRATAMPGEKPETLPPPERAAEAALALALPSSTQNGDIVTLS